MIARYKHYIWLLPLFTLSLAQGETKVNTRAECLDLLNPASKNLFPEKRAFGEKPDPVFYASNTEQLLEALKSKGIVEFQLSPFKEASGLQKLCSKEFGSCFVVVSKNPDGHYGNKHSY